MLLPVRTEGEGPGNLNANHRPPFIRGDELSRALQHADMRVLLMVIYHLTGDETWLSPPFEPIRDARLIPDKSAGLSAEAQNRIRECALILLTNGSLKPAIRDPGNEQMTRLMSICLGERVPGEYALLTREEMGLISRDVAWRSQNARESAASRPVLIVGAGVSGIVLGVRLKRLGIPFTIVEQNDGVGGTWHVNRYPGCGVDTPNHAYSFSFGERYHWSRYFSQRAEIKDYLQRFVDEFQLSPHIRFRTKLKAATWNAEQQVWQAELSADGKAEVLLSSYLVSAIGQLSDPLLPRVAGANEYGGLQFHSAEWPSSLDLSDRDVAVIGTGASSMQIVPSIAGVARKVTVYQRTAQWARPIDGYGDIIDEGTQWLLQNVPFYAEWFRFTMFWRYGDGLHSLLHIDPDWPHGDRSINSGNDRHRLELTAYIRRKLAGRPDLVAKCIPSYPPFGKRILLDNKWYDTLLRPDVELVSQAVKGLAETGVVTTDGKKRPADVVVWATGFRLTEMAARLNITGAGGVTLAEAWDGDNPTAYLGVAVTGFPNFFCMLGPNSGLGHGGSTMLQSECQARYITSCIVESIESGATSLDVRRPVQDAYVSKVDAAHERMIWSHRAMTTYYRNRHGRVFSVMPWRIVDYWSMTRKADLTDYEFSFS